MKIRNDYNNCLTNVACSIRKYFDLPYAHKTMPEVDSVLERKNPENVIVFLLDGVGANILKRSLPDPDLFLRKHTVKTMTSVFPATTTACTTSMLTGLNPVEHGWLGWDMYINSIDTTATLFLGVEKLSGQKISNYVEKTGALVRKYLPVEIDEAGKYDGRIFASFLDPQYYEFDNLINSVKKECKKKPKNGKRYIYAYDPIPDSIMHDEGADSEEVKKCLEERNAKLEALCSELKNSVVIVLADHGHIVQNNIFLKDYPEIEKMLERTPGIEQRAASFKVKPEYKTVFEEKFNADLGKMFHLYPAEEIIKSELFGDIGSINSPGENPLFRFGIEDYMAIAEDTNATLVSDSNVLYSGHAGYTDDEIYIPLIIAEV